MKNHGIMKQLQNHRIRVGQEKFSEVRIWAFIELSLERYLSQKSQMSIQRAKETKKDT